MKLRISVVSSPCNSPQEDGAGKSSLCQQFVYGRQVRVRKRWTDAEWDSSHINRNHFFYWGSAPLRLPNGTDLTIRIVEQTVIWHSESDTPFPNFNTSYTRQAVQTSLPSPGKSRSFPEQVSLYSHIGKGLHKPGENSCDDDKSYPSSEFTEEGINGFLCLVDPTLVDDCLSRQQQFLRSFVQLAKQANRKVVFLLSKCDLASAKQLIEARHFIRNKLRKQSPIIEVSAFDIYNINEAFIVIAQRCLRIKPVAQVLTWGQHKQANMLLMSRQICEFREYLLRIVEDSSWTWDEFLQQLKSSSQSFLATNIQQGELKRIFCLHILELKLKEAGNRFGLTPEDKTYRRLTSSQATESAKSYQGYLHDSIKSHPDLTPSYSKGDYSHYACVDTHFDKNSFLVSPPPLPPRREFEESSLSPVLSKGLVKLFGSKKLRKTKSWGGKMQLAIDSSPCRSKDDITFFPPSETSENDFTLLNSMLSNSHSREDTLDTLIPDNKDDTFRRRAKTTSSGKYLHRPLPPSPCSMRPEKKSTFPGTFNPRHSRSRSDQLSLTLTSNQQSNNQSFPDLSRTSVDLGEPAPYLDPIELNRFTMPRFRSSRYSETEGDVFSEGNFPKRIAKREYSLPLNDFNKRHSIDMLLSPAVHSSSPKRDASVQTYQRGERRRERRWEPHTSIVTTRISTSTTTPCACIQENTNEQDSGTASFSYSPPLPPDNSHLCGRITQGVTYDVVEP